MHLPQLESRCLVGNAVAAASLVALGALLAACSSTTAQTGLPALTKSCGHPVTPTGNEVIPFASLTTPAGSIPTVAVCIDGHGPYPFIVSTGAGTSVVSASLVSTLKLPEGAAVDVRGTTCTASAPTAQMTAISLGGVALAAQNFVVASVPAYGSGATIDGMIGSDILTRFGAIGIDYRSHKLTLAGAEGGPPPHNTIVLGQAKGSAPPGLLVGSPKVDTPIDVLESPTNTLVSVAVSLGRNTQQFTVDSGAPTSSVTKAAATTAALTAGSGTAPESGIGCSAQSSTFSSGSWTVNGVVLPSKNLVSQVFAGSANSSFDGSLGGDVLSSYQSVVLDYAGAHLWLGG